MKNADAEAVVEADCDFVLVEDAVYVLDCVDVFELLDDPVIVLELD